MDDSIAWLPDKRRMRQRLERVARLRDALETIEEYRKPFREDGINRYVETDEARALREERQRQAEVRRQAKRDDLHELLDDARGLIRRGDELIQLGEQKRQWLEARRVTSKPRGAPKKPEAEKTRAYYTKMGSPAKLTARVCDELAEHSYPDQYAKATLHSPARKRLRDRVAEQVRRLMNKADRAT